jgi:hypothetical protein
LGKPGGPFRRQPRQHLGRQAVAVEASQRAALIDQMQGGLVLAGGAEIP